MENCWNHEEELDQRPSFFEFMTLLSLVIFREEKVEVSVIEVGLGGKTWFNKCYNSCNKCNYSNQ